MKNKIKIVTGLMLLSLSFYIGMVANAEEIAYKIEQDVSSNGSGIINEDKPIIPQSNQKNVRLFSTLPSKFDYSSGNIKTAMRNQGELGICWAYSAVDVITSSNKKEFGTEYTLSPNYYNYYSATNAFTDDINPYGYRLLNTGNSIESVFMQSSLDNNGTLEEDFKTQTTINKNGSIKKSDFQTKKDHKAPIYVEGIEKIDGISYKNYTKDNQHEKIEKMKASIYKYGSVSFLYRANTSHLNKYYNSKTKATFVPITDVGTENVPTYGENWVDIDHGVVIVGWDDNFSRNNFTNFPEKDGAFLVKNSWGESSKSNGVGYFYISYEDIYILCSDNYTVDTKMEQYDVVNAYVNTTRSHYANLSSPNNEIYLGNVYTTGNTEEQLKAVSFYSEQQNINYDVYYLEGAIKSYETISNQEKLKKISSGVVESPGMKEIVTEPVNIDKNKEYTIIIKVNYPQDLESFFTPLQEVKDFTKGKFPDLSSGRSFISIGNMNSWRSTSNGEIFGDKLKANLYVNAYTDKISNEISVSDVNIMPKKNKLFVGDKLQLMATVTPENATNKEIEWSTSNEFVASVDEHGKLEALNAGEAEVIAKVKGTDKQAVAKVTVNQKGLFGTVEWEYDSPTSTLSFVSGGDFPEGGKIMQDLVFKNYLDNVSNIKFNKPVNFSEDSTHLFSLVRASVEGLDKVNTSKVTDMSNMFMDSSIKNLNISTWDTSNVTNMSGMFWFSNLVEKLDLNQWNTSNVTDMSGMFLNTDSLKEVNLGDWNTSDVTNMSNMFSASGIEKLDLSNWNTSKVTSMSDMFSRMSEITELDVSNFNTSNVTRMNAMFCDSPSLTQLDVSNWNTSNVTDMNGMFQQATNLKELDVSKWDTSKVADVGNMFKATDQLTKLTLGPKSIFYIDNYPSYIVPEKIGLSGKWTCLENNLSYDFGDAFMKNYDGSSPGIYVRQD